MNEVTKFDPETGEVMSTGVAALDAGSAPLAVQLARVELDQAISTAKAYPRSLTRVRDNIDALVMLDDETAKECVYALPRGGKPIKGPSVRFAEIVASQYGNCKVGSRVVDVNRFEKYIEAEGVFIDLEAGMTRTARIRRRITDKHGKLFNDDMIVVTGNAACAIALREAVLKGVPKALWRRAYEAAEGVIAGDVKTLTERREGAIKAFAAWGVTPDQIFAALEVDGLDDVGLDEIATLTAIFKAIKSGEQQVEDYFPAKKDAKAGVEAAKGTAAKLGKIAEGNAAAKQAPKEQASSAPERAAQADQAPEATDGAANAETATQAATGAQDGATQTEGNATAPAEDGERQVTDEEAAQAFERGKTARQKGMSRKACPPEYRDAQRLFDAWNEGWEAGTPEAAEGA
jgi:hypothetical protein